MNDSHRVDRNGTEEFVENVPFADLRIGQSASLTRRLERADIELFAAVSGDLNPTHLDDAYAGTDRFHKVIGHGLWGGSLISALLGSRLPGPGTIYVGQDMRFRGPIAVGDTITATVTVREKRDGKGLVVLDCRCTNQDGDDVLTGIAEVIAPLEKIRHRPARRPKIEMIRHDGHDELLRKCQNLPRLPTAIVHPCDAVSLAGAIEAAEADLIEPFLVGPEARIRKTAEAAGIDLAPYRIVAVEHSHAAAETAVAMARSGEARALMKGSLHTDELMGAVVKRGTGLRTERRISHAFVMNVPSFNRPLMITDAAINISPTLEDKAHICQNAIDLALALGTVEPKVAIISAVEQVTAKLPGTLDAAALCKMAERGQIRGGILDGPLAFDNAISTDAALLKGLRSPVAGRADIILVPNLEAGNMLAKQLAYMANADGAGVVLGARVPIILTSRADTVRTRLASCAAAVLSATAAARRELPHRMVA